jgi:7,8-dihydropterin-6-yl-methyl-4-(beta-D-ribofuranosyl)aminobenzene 5'-phosphate synthase
VREATTLAPGINLTGAIPRETSYEDPGGPFYLDTKGERADPIDDDLALWIETAEGSIVCVGCCHAGVVNTLNHVKRISHGARIRAVIGGLHLVNASLERLERTIDVLRADLPDIIVPCHCTGDRALRALGAALGDRLSPCHAGLTYSFN